MSLTAANKIAAVVQNLHSSLPAAYKSNLLLISVPHSYQRPHHILSTPSSQQNSLLLTLSLLSRVLFSMASPKYCYITLLLLVSLCSSPLLADRRQDPEQSSVNGKLQSIKQNKQHNATTCRNSDDLAKNVEVCAEPLMDILQGTIEKWPSNNAEAGELCDKFAPSERCIRDKGRRCAVGLQKAIISTLANSIARARKRECLKSKLPMILRTTQCIEKNQDLVQALIANVTSRLSVIELQMSDLDVKTNAVCCMVHSIEKEIKILLDPICKEESATVIKLYRAVLEDVIELICRSPKCNDIFKGYKMVKQNPNAEPVGIIAVLLRIVFSLG